MEICLSDGEGDQDLDDFLFQLRLGVDSPGRVVGGGGVDSMLQFHVERGRRRDEALPKDEAEAAKPALPQ
jgi:hypothetical protein